MSTAKSLVSPEEYLARERQSPVRHEFYQGEIFAMGGASEKHCLAKDNLASEIRAQLKQGPCKVVTSDLRVKVSPTGLYTYPDIVIYCNPAIFEDRHGDTLVNPTAIIEVLSESTERYDRGQKFHHYQRIDSLREYILVSQDEPRVERYTRQPAGDQWLFASTLGLEAVLTLECVPVQVPLVEIYRGIQFE